MANIYGCSWSRQELLRHVGHMDQLAGIKLLEAADGVERGTRALQVWTGSGLNFQVLADRAMDISSCHYKGLSLAWTSPVGAPHPAYYEASGLDWLRSFQGGLLVTCGLDQFGPPCRDAGEDFGLHGRLSNLPARAVSCQASWVGDDYELAVSGEIRQARVFGENMVLRRRISTRLGSNQIRIEDVVANEGFSPNPHMILYHINLGFPLLSESTELKVEAEKSLPRDAVAEEGIQHWHVFQAPTPGYQEQVFLHTPLAGADGRAKVEVRNPALGLGLRLSFDKSTLPYMMEWKMMGEGLYVLGVEPSNCRVIGGRAMARQQDALPMLAAGESRRYSLDLEVVELSGRKE